jgi:hypothetical protein
MFQYRQVLLRLRQGDSDRDIARSGLMGRPKVAVFRLLADSQGWLKPEVAPPDDAASAAVISAPRRASSTISSVEPYRTQVERWVGQASTALRSTRRCGVSTDFAVAIRRCGGCSRRFMPACHRRRL